MAWTWKITLGTMLDQKLAPIGEGYAGNGKGLNNPAMTKVPNVGPLPVGRYLIGLPYNDAQVGVYALPLIPNKENEMFGRSLFRIHGDNSKLDHSASHGCIVVPRTLRTKIATSDDHDLIVEA